MKQSNQYNFLIHSIGRTTEALGIDPGEIFEAAKVNPELLEKAPTILSEHQLADLCRELKARTNAPDLGLILGINTRSNDHSVFAYLGLTSATMRDAICSMQRFRGLVSNVIKTSIKFTDTELIMRMTCDNPPNNLYQTYIEWELAADLISIREILGKKIHFSSICVDYPEPAYSQKYQQIFGCPIFFNQDVCEIRIPIEHMDLPLPSYDPVVKAAMEEVCKRMVGTIDAKRSIVDNVRSIIMARPGSFPKQEFAAEKLNISPRTLHRRLKECNTNYQLLLDDARSSLAKHYLEATDLQVQKISELCGFIDAQNFSIAFKRWTGHSPSSFRSQLQK